MNVAGLRHRKYPTVFCYLEDDPIVAADKIR
jgi:hypothetical protein